MVINREVEARSSAFYKRLTSFLYYNSGYSIGGIARSSSRASGQHRDISNLDVIFWIRGDPSKTDVYMDLIEKLRSIMNLNANKGMDSNVVKIWKKGIKCDLVLLPEFEYKIEIDSGRYIS
ncbi:MAG: hypothetical protein ACTSQP_11835 [Promethearchaeota archaeon]